MIYVLYDHEKLIKYKGKYVMIDKNDEHLLNEYSWYHNRGYLTTTYRFHQMVMNFKPKVDSELSIDHITRDVLDNRKSNLRIVDRSTQSTNRSFFKGYYLKSDKSGNPLYWIGELYKNGIKTDKTFSIKKFGYEKAKQLAIEYRKKLLSECKYNDQLKYDDTSNIILDELEEYVKYKGKTILIDREDKHYLNEYSWHYDSHGYLITKIMIHFFIMDFKPNLDNKLSIDHKNRDKFDQTRNNLRIVNKNIQAINRNKQKNNTSGVVGVSYDKTENKERWRAMCVKNGDVERKSFS